MKAFIKRFDREQVGLDHWQCAVFVISVLAILCGATQADNYWFPGGLAAFLYLFGSFLLLFDFLYVAASIVLTRGNWRQYCVYLLLSFCVGLMFLLILPSLAKAKE
ncbi:MAG: hypothetical protein HKL96_11490 [Phycisphaerales bacterium]|nr:hypothetical protein [Phycisphaerales bacterium]